MKEIIEKIDALRKELKSLQPMLPEYQRQLEKKFRLEFSFNSNHLEGNTLTYGETIQLLLFDQTQGVHTMREYEEMKAHDAAFQLTQQWALDDRPLSETDIKNLNKILLVKPFWKEAITEDGQPTRRLIKVGEYKEFPNSVRLANGEIFHYASPLETPALMEELVIWFNKQIAENETHPILIAALFHYKFVSIHPFDDGNGRVARLLMNYTLAKFSLPPVIIKSVDKNNYLRALNAADAGEMETFTQYIAEQLQWSLQIAVKAAKGEKIDEPDDLDKELHLLKRKLTDNIVINQKASTQTIIDALEQVVIPMFALMEEKARAIKDLFHEIKISVQPTYLLNNEKITPVIDLNPDSSEQWWGIVHYPAGKRFESIGYRLDLNGLKSTSNANCFTISLDVEFREYNYIIRRSWATDDSVPLVYGRQLDKAAMTNIITPALKKLIDDINAATK